MAANTGLVARAAARTGLDAYVAPARVSRLLRFALVGASGVPIDLAITTTAMPAVGVLAAQVAGWVTAATWNYSWNRAWTWTTAAPVVRTWLRYLTVDSGRLAIRLAAVAVLLHAGLPALAATGGGIVTATGLGFLGFDRVVFRD